MTPSTAIRAFKRAIYRPRTLGRRAEKKIVRQFHKLYYYARERTWKDNTFWLNVPTAKCPLDLWVYQEIICETKPDVIIESGTAHGGSALFLSSICDSIQRGRIITIDVRELPDRPQHQRIKYLVGSSISEEIVEEVRRLIRSDDRVMVILDSDHNAEHVLNELHIYGQMVTIGNYLIVEDTNANGHPVFAALGRRADGGRRAIYQHAEELCGRSAKRKIFHDLQSERIPASRQLICLPVPSLINAVPHVRSETFDVDSRANSKLSKNPRPLVSVVLLSYNRPLFLQEALVSLLNQSYENIEITVVDNPSPASAEVARIVKQYKNVRLIQSS